MTSKRKKKEKRKFRFLWITDPWNSLDHPKDTSLRWIEESLKLGFESEWCDVRSIRMESNQVLLDAFPVLSVEPGRKSEGFSFGPLSVRSPRDFDSLQYRVDPPVDAAYLHPLQLLALTEERKPLPLTNPLPILLMAGEKLEAMKLGPLHPPTVVSSRWEILSEFGIREGKTVLKPLHQAQSKGVELLDWTQARASGGIEEIRSRLARASAEFSRPLVLQKFLEKIQEGETRLWFLDGKLLAQVRKLPSQGDFRVNIDQGSRLAPTRLTPQETRAARQIGSHLKRKKIRLAAVDLIDGLITDFNFTSPGLIVQMEQLLERNLSRSILLKLTKLPTAR